MQQEDVGVTAIYRNRAGRILGGGRSSVSFVRPDRQSSFEVDPVVRFRGVATTEMHFEFSA
jgi:hypothetical protein